MFRVVTCVFCALTLGSAAFATLDNPNKKPETVVVDTPSEKCLAPITVTEKPQPVANYYETHMVGKCDSQRTKRRAHMYSSHNIHKQLDNDLILGSYEYCCSYTYFENGNIESKTCDPQCVDIARMAEERQRDSGRRGIVQGLGVIGASVLGLSGVSLLGN